MAKRSTASLIKYVKFLMDAGAMERPVWLDAVVRCVYGHPSDPTRTNAAALCLR